MKRLLFANLLILSVLAITYSCNCPKSCCKAKKSENSVSIPGPGVIIYQTTSNYNDNVPVILNNTKTEIISYPGIMDIRHADGFPLPTLLDNGFLLDNRGINENVAFLKYTYQEYASLKETPKPDELFNLIIDKNPLKQMYKGNVRSTYQDVVVEMNNKIKNNDFSGLKRLK